jgi:hypothetical protein
MNNEWSSISAQVRGGFLDRQIRRTNRNLLLVNLLLIVGVAIYAVVEWRYFYNFFAGPVEARAESLGGSQRPDDVVRYFVTVHGEKSVDTGMQEIKEETRNGVHSESVNAKYSILFLGNRLLIVKKNPGDNGTTMQGALGELTSDVRTDILDPLVKKYPDASQAFLPVMLDATSFRSDGYIAMVICIPLALLAVWNIRKVIRRKSGPQTHPIVQSACRYGPLVDVAKHVDAELRGNTAEFGKARVTTFWVFLPSMYGLAMCHIPDLVWAYKKVTTRRRNSQYMGTTHDVIMYDRYTAVPLQMRADQKRTDAMLSVLVERAPWAIFGYSDELDKTRQTNWGGMVAAVDAKRAGVLGRRSA